MGNCRDDAGDIKLVLLISKGSNNFHLIFIDMITKCLKKEKALICSIHVKSVHTFLIFHRKFCVFQCQNSI